VRIFNFCKVGNLLDVASFYFGALALFIAGIISACIPQISIPTVNRLAHGFAALGSIAGVLCAFSVFTGAPWGMTLPLAAPFGNIVLTVDYLGAVFVLALGIVGIAASIFAVGYSREYHANRFRQMAGLFNAFLFSMVLVLTTGHVLAFLVAWELMALVSFFLVAHDDRDPENIRSAYIYLIMTHIGTVFVASAFFILASSAGSMDFNRLGTGQIDEQTANWVFLCTLIGFGTKAGAVPLHIWLPRAHPIAPSHVSALMSGVMIKTAIYAMARFYLDFLPTGPVWWGIAVLVVAAVSAVLGVLYALMENDLKRLLAYSSVENIGLILMGIGAGLVFAAKGNTAFAAIAWTAAFYHTVSHAVFKSLLFLGAGSVMYGAHTRNIEKLGGLIKQMPKTAIAFLVGSAAISALPPLSGFVSEWLTFQSLFLLPAAIPSMSGRFMGAALIALFGLTGALAAACFVKAFGITFLAKPRSPQAEHAREVPAAMWASTGLLAVVSLLFGVWPQLLLASVGKMFVEKSVDQAAFFSGVSWYSFALQHLGADAALSPAGVLGLIAVGLIGAIVIFRRSGNPVIHSHETWTCGIVPDARMEYTGTGFSKPIRMAFRSILRPQRETLVEEGGTYYGRKLSYHLRIRYVFNELYGPLNAAVIRLAYHMKRIQTGSVQLYIGYITAVTVLVLIWNAWWSN
jgi:hydrogenase-4 component B